MSVKTERWWSASTCTSTTWAPRDPERPPDRGDDTRVAPLGHVRHGLEGKHPPTLESVREPTAPAYYDRRAPEYDDWYRGVGLYADRDRPGFDAELSPSPTFSPRSRPHGRSTSRAGPAS